MSHQGFSPTPEQFEVLFPFHFVIDRNLRLVHVGAALARIEPTAVTGRGLLEIFSIQSPERARTWSDLRSEAASVFILEAIDRPQLVLRGQLLFSGAEDQCVFVGSPWITDASVLPKLGLKLQDFALHEPLVDFFHVTQSLLMSAADSQELANRLQEKRKELESGSRALSVYFQVSEVLAGAASLAESGGALLQTVCQAYDWDVGEVWTIHESSNRLNLVTSWRSEGTECQAYVEKTKRTGGERERDLLAHMVAGARPEWLGTQTLLPDHLRREGFVSAYVSPLDLGAKRLGVIRFLGRHVREREPNFERAMTICLGRVESFFRERQARRELSRSERKLRQTYGRIVALIDGVPSGIMVEDEHRNILHVNRTFCDLFSIPLSPQQLIGSNCADLADGMKSIFVDPDGFQESVHKAISGKTKRQAETVQLIDGRVLERDYVPIQVEGVYRGHLWHYRDVSESKKLERSLVAATETALAASRHKSEFLANMSHEIRTPMNGVLGMAEILSGTSLDSDQREQLNLIRTSGEALLGIVNDILDFSKIEAGKLSLENTIFSPESVVEEVVRTMLAAAQEKGIELYVRAQGLRGQVSGDAHRFRQIVSNLVGNAVKFTSKGSVSVVLTGAPGGEAARQCLKLEVIDTGIGIPTGALERIFDPFSQADSSTTRQFGGSGLGLSISRRLAEMMKGELKVASQVGRGSHFTLTVEFPEVQATPVRREAFSEGVEPLVAVGAVRVLLVEDNLINQQVASQMLARLGFAVDIAEDGRKALERLEKGQYAAVLLDCQMPELDGYDTARLWREKEAASGTSSRVPIIGVTAHALKGDREKCLSAGMDDYLPKPIRLPMLRMSLRRFFSDERKRAA